jgi:hypothetical protein
MFVARMGKVRIGVRRLFDNDLSPRIMIRNENQPSPQERGRGDEYTIVRYAERRAFFPPYFKLLFGTISQTVVWSNLISLQLRQQTVKTPMLFLPPPSSLQKIVTFPEANNGWVGEVTIIPSALL